MKNIIVALTIAVISFASGAKDIEHTKTNEPGSLQISLSHQNSEMNAKLSQNSHINNMRDLPAIKNIEMIPTNFPLIRPLPTQDELKVGFDVKVNKESQELEVSYSYIADQGSILLVDPNNPIKREFFHEPEINLHVHLETPASATIEVEIPEVKMVKHVIKYNLEKTGQCFNGQLPAPVMKTSTENIKYNVCMI